MMPNMDGYEACPLIKSSPAGRTIPILMLTALTGTEDKIRALESGADDFLNKPINREELRTRIRSLIKIRNLRKELDSSENIIMTLTSALESKDPRTIGHVHRVAVVRRAPLRQARHVRRREGDRDQGRDAARRRHDRRARSPPDDRAARTTKSAAASPITRAWARRSSSR